ncbi:MAG: LicD family protein, partial [Mogibacterium sp.]|nr:LicD family protein [Mogibacterium sp.]
MSTKLQGILKQLLFEIDEICRQHNIRYYIWGGTCIGQLRHGGFIPWDDDIDIVMPRKDYDKLEAVISECMPEGRDLISSFRYPSYTNP